MSLDLICTWQGNIEFLARLVVRNVRFVIVGSTATRFYLPEREVDDLDLLIDPALANAELFIDALNEKSSFQYDIAPSALTKPKIRFPVKNYLYLDIITPADTVEFNTIWVTSIETKVAYQSSPIEVRVASIPALIGMLRSSDQEKHKSDLQSLIELGDVYK